MKRTFQVLLHAYCLTTLLISCSKEKFQLQNNPNNSKLSTTSNVNVAPYPKPILDFSYSNDGLVVTFTNSSKGGSSYNWDFGDGETSTQRSPQHTYTKTGRFTVLLSSEDNAAVISKTINVNPILPIPQFGYVTGINKGEVLFVDSSANAINYSWNFGDSTFSNEKNPKHIYTRNGNYSVTLTVTSKTGTTKSISKNIYILIPTADFDMLKDATGLTKKVSFINRSNNTNTYEWSFGDGETSTELNPIHEYKKSGIFEVKLIAISNIGSRAYIIKTVSM